MAYKATRQYFFVSTSELKMVGIMPPLQPPQGPAHARAGAHAAALYPLRTQPVGRLHPAQPPHPGGPDGVFDGACAEVVAAAGVNTEDLSNTLGVTFVIPFAFDFVTRQSNCALVLSKPSSFTFSFPKEFSCAPCF